MRRSAVAFGSIAALTVLGAQAEPQKYGADGMPHGAVEDPLLFVSIAADGIVTITCHRAEMGQGVRTGNALIVADELEADWSKVRINHVDSAAKWGLMVTGGSWSVWQSYPLMSQAGAAGRMVLIEEGAKLLGVDPKSCTAANSVVSGGGPGG